MDLPPLSLCLFIAGVWRADVDIPLVSFIDFIAKDVLYVNP